jgi:lysophospholipase L1-like esterase
MVTSWFRRPKDAPAPWAPTGRPLVPYIMLGNYYGAATLPDPDDAMGGPSSMGYAWHSGAYIWSADKPPGNSADVLFEHYLSRYTAKDADAETQHRRVFVLGGSLALGSSASTQDAAWHAQLEGLMAEQGPVRVFNAGLGAAVSTQELLILVLGVMHRRPDEVIFLTGFNDASQPWLYGSRPGDPHATTSLFSAWYARRGVNGPAAIDQERLRDAQDRERRERLIAGTVEVLVGNMRRAAAICAAVGARCHVVLQPWRGDSMTELGQVEPDIQPHVNAAANEAMQRMAQGLAAEPGINFLDARGLTRREDRIGWYTDCCHLNDEGQKGLAEAIFSGLKL